MKNLIFAAIDIGSYNCRLTIVKKLKYNFKVIHNFSYGTNLISNLSFNNEFTEKNIEKTLKCLKKFSEKLLKFKVNNYRCIATEACRQVINPDFFIEKVKTKALGQEVVRSISPAQMVVKIVNDELINLLGSENNEINLSSKPPALIMMVGLQGSGKTTSTAKISHWIEKNKKKKSYDGVFRYI